MTSKALYFRLLSYVAPYRKIFSLSILFTVTLAITEPMMPALLKPLLDGSFVDKDPTIIRLMPLALIGLVLIRGISTFISTFAINWVATRVVMDLRNQIFNRLLVLPNRFYDDNPTGNLISKITFNVEQVTSASTDVLIVLVRDSVAILGLLAWMFYLNWELTLFILVLAPVIALVVKIVSHRLRRLSHSIQTAMADMTDVLEEGIQGNRVVKLFGGQAYEIDRFQQVSNWVRRFNMKRIVAGSASSPIVQFIAVSALAGIFYVASLQSLEDKVTVGSFVSFITAIALLLSPLKKLTSVNEKLQQGLAAAESVFELLDQEPEPDAGTITVNRLAGQLTFDNVGFSYHDAPTKACSNISFVVEPGERIALVGPSGGGKSTLASLIPRFYNPTEGRIFIDNIDTQALPLADLRSNLALVSQDVVLFNDSVAANIAYGQMRGITKEAVVAAAKAAHAWEFIDKMPQGLDTLIGENGVRLSGGQRQRLAIARALLKDAPILILDEATSALDNESERYIQDALDKLTRHRTTLIIAHRLSTIENADRILVLEGGHLIESGTHRELLNSDGLYRRLYDTQFSVQDKF